MVIISVSLNDIILQELDNIKDEQGFSGRSEVIRAGIRLLLSENKDMDKIIGDINSILLLIHSQDVENIVSEIKHQFEDITKTQVHSHLKGNKCLEIFILEGNAQKIKNMVKLFKINGKIDYIKLIVP